MSLDTEKLHRLRSKKFDDLYEKKKAKWNELADNTTGFVKSFMEKNGEPIHPGDIAAALRTAIRVDPDFEKFLEDKSLHQKYWVEYFCDYIVEQKYGLPSI